MYTTSFLCPTGIESIFLYTVYVCHIAIVYKDVVSFWRVNRQVKGMVHI